MRDYVDIYLPDYKYADATLAEELSRRKNYPVVAREAIGEMLNQKSNRYDPNGIMLEGVIVRHLVIPGEIKNIFAVLDT
jgi:putative pyruvate formate lyase activating enzyme